MTIAVDMGRKATKTNKIFIPMNLLYRFPSSCYTWNDPVFKCSVNPDQKPVDPDPDCFPLITANECMKIWDKCCKVKPV